MDEHPSATMSPRERMRLRAAAITATEVYPGAVGELLAREIAAWEDFGHRFGVDRLMSRVVGELLDRG